LSSVIFAASLRQPAGLALLLVHRDFLCTFAKTHFLSLMWRLSLGVWRSKRIILHIHLMGKATEEKSRKEELPWRP
jgi:hypothetical protein